MKKDVRLLAAKIANKVPSINRHLTEKQLLYEKTIQQEQAVISLKRQNKELYNELYKGGKLEGKKTQVIWPLLEKEVQRVEKTKLENKLIKCGPPFTINWVVPALIRGSGGQTDIVRTISYFEAIGHKCRIYFYDPANKTDLKYMPILLKGFPKVKAELFYNSPKFNDADITFATDWVSAYPVYNTKIKTNKYYYVQDFEPYFVPNGTLKVLAENTYRFGLRGVTLGQWLSQKLTKEYSMQCNHFNFGFDPSEYQITGGNNSHKAILFYARPRSPRRGFELGIMALKQFHKRHPDYKINFFGEDVSSYDIPFPYENRGVLDPGELNKLYNKCAAGLVLSFTNMSLVPLEMISSGCTPVVNEANYTKLVPYAQQTTYAEATPRALSLALEDAVQARSTKKAKEASDIVKRYTWEASNEQIHKILLSDLAK